VARFQSFEDGHAASDAAPRVAALRGLMPELGVDGILLPRADAWLGEFIAPAEERLAWLTAFTGSAGSCLVLARRALLFLDGRYLQQGREQTDPGLFEIVDVSRFRPHRWIGKHLPPGARIAVDPWLHPAAEMRQLEAAGARLVAQERNPVDRIRRRPPERPPLPPRPQPKAFRGPSSREKRSRAAEVLRRNRLAAFLFADPESVCWLFNIRGSDAPCTPVVHARALLDGADGAATLFLAPERVTGDVRDALGPDARIAPPGALADRLAERRGERVGLDFERSPDRLRQMLQEAGAEAVDLSDPVAVPKAVKCAGELEGARHAHRLDGAAMARFLAWPPANAPTAPRT